ncbi:MULTISPECIES: PP2C family protein-serine/threonine phosphatase [Streptomyces]|uniref:PP2C family protein-serine/threonine phosphatase n=1 Tax=Streptomyces caniscabiei TaxID=2746961 RepID=A0ABU4MG19_9ACTN|nr:MULTISPECIES: PP2C family protein-serine/threonine phosphatase [Streptomyces]MBE4734694.1 serine/threonine-protein phosphatase [Streptomyces caniscabiei]MBE4753828.1 serine/threonine-protein phosphatase [Streptomyces caniscabiei]MBE4767421.1 serine/threonine-protein phosphatase [Streptomyces caniscabiei]MBE4783806.1 serine/threonine-protein phosphatase [Streptomyces caniscabiei]MBE4791695.1 serine/threonine-protein phosphatase [Streptomyces caniscabiei]
MLDIPSRVRVHVETLLAAQNDMGVCDAFEQYAPVGKPDTMNAPHPPKVAGIDSTVPSPAHTVAPAPAAPSTPTAPPATGPGTAPGAVLQDRLAGWVSDLTTLHELTERLTRTDSLDSALTELLHAGAALVGARRGLVVLEPADGLGPDTTVGLGLGHADLGHIETVPRSSLPYGRILDGLPGGEGEIAQPDLFAEDGLDPRHREVAARLGYAASYALPLSTERAGRLGAAVWLYDEPAEPVERQRHLVGLYTRYAAEHLARIVEVERTRTSMATIAEELLPSRLPRVFGVQLAARHRTGPRGGGDWYDALPLPDAALGLAVGSVTGSGPSAIAAMGRLRASLRAYAVMEGEDPVAVLSDLELLLRLTEPARSATALFAYVEPALRKITLAGAGHSPPLVIGERRTEYVETSLSAPLGMLACWEAPSIELTAEPGETVLLYTDGLLQRTGEPVDRAFTRLHAAAAGVPRALRDDPGALADHILRTMLPGGLDEAHGTEDVVLLAARFE